jgi:chorismate mutase/prephenate dehydratase
VHFSSCPLKTQMQQASPTRTGPAAAGCAPVSPDAHTKLALSGAPLPPPRPLSELRTLIDTVDAQLVSLLNQRAALVMEVGRRKAADGTPVYAPHREQAVLARVLEQSTGPLLPVTLEAVYREIMSGSFALERPLRIRYLGPPGSFTHEAASKQFGSSIAYENLRTIEGVFEEVARGHVDYGVVPVENAAAGSVSETLDAMLGHCGRVTVCAEVQLAVSQALIACPGAVPSDIRVVVSKAEALAQCRRWLGTQYPAAQQITATSTSAAVEQLAAAYTKYAARSGGGVDADDPRHTAVVASALAA